jgi:UDP-N-acetyl-D-glucosamine dehydrogenase
LTTTRGATGARKWNPLIERFQSREALVVVVGLGYVGFPVALTFAEAGFRVTGVDLDAERVQSIREGSSYLHDVPDERLQELLETKRFKVQSSYGGLDEADAILICLPTPLTDGLPDLSYIVDAGKALVGGLGHGTLIVLESTTYPGTT